MPFHEAWWQRWEEAFERHIESFNKKELKEALADATELAKAAATGRVTPKTFRSLRRLIQGLFRDLDRLAKRRRARVRLVGKNKFIIESDNPGHGFLVQFAPFFLTGFGPRDPGQAKLPHEIFHAGEALVEDIQRKLGEVMDVLELVQQQPQIFAEVLQSVLFETPGEFFEKHRG